MFLQVSICPQTGSQSLSKGSLSRGSLSRGVTVQGDPLYGNVRAVCILLECILVTNIFDTEFAKFSETFRKNSNATQERLTQVSTMSLELAD